MGEQNQQQNTMWMFLKNFSNKFSIPDFVNGNDKRGRKHISYDRIGNQDDKSDFLSSSNPHLLDIVGKTDSVSGLDLDSEPHVGDRSRHFLSSNVNATAKTSAPVAKSLSASHTTPSLSSVANAKSSSSSSSAAAHPTNRLGSISFFKGGGRSVDYNLKTKKFVFPNRVPSYQSDQDKDGRGRQSGAGTTTTNITENVKDANWLEIEDEDEESEDDKGDNYDGASSCSSDYEDDDDQETRNGTRCGICGCEKKYEGLPSASASARGADVVKFN